MALFTNLQSLSQTAGANPPDGSADAPSTIPTDLRLLGSFDAIMRDGGHQWASAVGGTNTIAITVNGISSLVAGQTFRFVAAGANTGAVTLNANSLGAKNVNKFGATALAPGDIANLSTVTVTYDGTNFQLVSVALPASLGANGWQQLPSGLILNWGSLSITSGTAGVANTATGTFPLAFPTACLFMFGYHNSADSTYLNCNAAATSLSAYQVALISGVSNLTRTVYWIALGK